MTVFTPANTPGDWNVPRRLDIDSNLLLARDAVQGKFVVHKFGRVDNVGTSEEDVWSIGGIYPWPTASMPLRIRSAGDAANDQGGTGARSIFIRGLDGDFNQISETLRTSGSVQSLPTSQSFMRVWRTYVDEVGVYGGVNTGSLIVENISGSALAGFEDGTGQSQVSMYTIPAGHVGYLTTLFIDVDGRQSAHVRMWQRENANNIESPFRSRRMILQFDGVVAQNDHDFRAYPRFPEKTDIWFSAFADSSTTDVNINYDLVIIESTPNEKN